MGSCIKKPRKVRPSQDCQDNHNLPIFSFKQKATTKRPISELILHKDISDDYSFGKILGKGHFGIVRKAYSKADPQFIVAIKSIEKRKVSENIDLLKNEVEILSSLDHPNIIKFYDSYEDTKFLHLVTEFCSGGELFDYVITKGHYSERKAAKLIYKILLSVNHIHSQGICHKDLKPENFLFENTDPNAELKLIDFGLSSKFRDSTEPMHDVVGTPYYVAPEVLHGSYGPECDLWSIGVISFVLLSGNLPFPGSTDKDIFRKILKNELRFRGYVWECISEEAKDFISKLLIKNPTARMTCEQALNHVWIKEAKAEIKISIDTTIIDTLRTYKAKSKLQREAYSVLVKLLSVKELKELRNQFSALDNNHSGTITMEELRIALERAGYKLAKEEIDRIMENIDYIKGGEIYYSDFLAATVSSKKIINEQMIWAVFKRFDIDNSGSITFENLREVFDRLGKQFNDREIKDMIQEINSDGHITFDQFKKLFKTSE
jgi:calcium-dependent protein kinase